MLLDLLVCRVQRDVRRDENARLFLERVRPGVNKHVQSSMGRVVRDREGVSARELTADIEALIIEEVLTGYVYGSSTPITAWLFAPRTGTVARYLQERRRALLRRGEEVAVDEQALGERPSHGEWALPPGRVTEALAHPSFAPNERRLLGYALRAGEFSPMEYARLVGRNNDIVRREYAVALKRLATVLGVDDEALGHLASEVPDSARQRRRTAWLYRDRRLAPGLTDTEEAQMLRLAAAGENRADVAWAFGVTENTLARRARRAKS